MLVSERKHLCKYNLHDTYKNFPQGELPPDAREGRTANGMGNDLKVPMMGAQARDNCRLIGEHIWEPCGLKTKIIKMDAKDVVTTEQANLQLATLIQALPWEAPK